MSNFSSTQWWDCVRDSSHESLPNLHQSGNSDYDDACAKITSLCDTERGLNQIIVVSSSNILFVHFGMWYAVSMYYGKSVPSSEWSG